MAMAESIALTAGDGPGAHSIHLRATPLLDALVGTAREHGIAPGLQPALDAWMALWRENHTRVKQLRDSVSGRLGQIAAARHRLGRLAPAYALDRGSPRRFTAAV
jgi:hypothetical protein